MVDLSALIGIKNLAQGREFQARFADFSSHFETNLDSMEPVFKRITGTIFALC